MMNADLPAGIESYLKEAGFSSTEMLLLRKLVEEDALTLRELASKTGRSTGVLDQAMKKLIKKKIAEKKMHNGQPRYSILSLDAALQWVQKDMKERKETLERKHQNFQDYISTLKFDKERPDIEYFSGKEGIEQAYTKILETGDEILTIGPILHTPEEDPLRAFKVDLFRKRQYRKIFHRLIAPDTPTARRFRTRDPFEYRKTLLVPSDTFPYPFEKTIAGDIVACIDNSKESVSFIRFPELAKAERAAFEAEWQREMERERGEGTGQTIIRAPIPLNTRFLSAVREFVLSKKSIAAFVLLALISGGITFGLYQNNRHAILQRISEKVIAIAATGALQFDANDVEKIYVAEDIQKPEYAKLITTLNQIRDSNPVVQYVYIMRKTDDPVMLAFVADADSLDPSEKKDINDDGIIDESDRLSPPGELYDSAQYANIIEGFTTPIADFGVDQWGSFISGYAPIRDEAGDAVAILGIDIFTEELKNISAESFVPAYFFFGFFFLFLVLRFIALNRSLLFECARVLKPRRMK